MHSDILNNFLDREVEVSTTTGKIFSGNLKLYDIIKEVIVLDPKSRRYGDTVIRQKDIVSLREILPQIKEDDGECDDKKMGPYYRYNDADA